jgi:euchromatic histone-lysine N-methyltransferase
VQLGIRERLEVYLTSRKGWGVRARHDIKKGSFISEYSGVMKVAAQHDEVTEHNWYSFEIATELGTTNYYIDATKKGNVSRFFNHSCNPNMFAVHVYHDDNNDLFGMHICFFAKRDIRGYIDDKHGEELTFDYGDGYWLGKAEKGVSCDCSAKNCRFRTATRGKKRKAAPTVSENIPVKVAEPVAENIS